MAKGKSNLMLNKGGRRSANWMPTSFPCTVRATVPFTHLCCVVESTQSSEPAGAAAAGDTRDVWGRIHGLEVLLHLGMPTPQHRPLNPPDLPSRLQHTSGPCQNAGKARMHEFQSQDSLSTGPSYFPFPGPRLHRIMIFDSEAKWILWEVTTSTQEYLWEKE